MKKGLIVASLVLSGLVLASCSTKNDDSTNDSTKQTEISTTVEESTVETDVATIKGKITKITGEKVLFKVSDSDEIRGTFAKDSEFFLILDEVDMVKNNEAVSVDALEVGDELAVELHKNAPMTRSMPPQYMSSGIIFVEVL